MASLISDLCTDSTCTFQCIRFFAPAIHGDNLMRAIGSERDPLLAAKRNVLHGTERIRREFQEHPEMRDVAIKGAVYDIGTGAVEWL